VIDQSELQQLASFKAKGSSVLSLYVNTDLTQQPKEQSRLVLRNLLDSVAGMASDEDRERVEQFFDLEYDWQGKSVALFSSVGQDLWRVYPLALELESEAHASDRLYLRPLTELLGEYDRHGVILVDRESARFLVIHMGQITEDSEWVGEDLKRHKQGGFAAARYQRHVDKQAEQNLKTAAEAATRFCRENRCRGIILGGAEDTLAQFQAMLPKAMLKSVIGTIAADMADPRDHLMARAVQLVRQQERTREQRLVEQMITGAAKGAGAVTGLADTFYVANQGRVHTLVVDKGFEAEGYLCDGCGLVSADPVSKCPSCGDKPQQIEDTVNRVMQKVIESGGQVKVVSDNKALAEAGRVGAILRY
jgi:peptide subunit release factor 1 (eRF1)